jgi:hypothetical protein
VQILDDGYDARDPRRVLRSLRGKIANAIKLISRAALAF